jgi:hypothetical protein
MIELPAADITYTAGRLTITVPEPDTGAMVAKLKSQQMYVKFGKPRKPRSTGPVSQNHHLNGHIMQIARATGDDFESVKLAVKHHARAQGYPGKEIAGQWIPQSEADSDTAECAILIEACHQVAAFLEVRLIETEPEITSKPEGYYRQQYEPKPGELGIF